MPEPTQVLSGKARVRLGTRYRGRSAGGKHAHRGVGASARDLIAFTWAVAQEGPLTLSPKTAESPAAVLRQV
jgi:hypothetical protein